MSKKKSNLLILAKYVNREIMIEDLFRVKGSTVESILIKYSKKKNYHIHEYCFGFLRIPTLYI
ncbi:MAG: hypothetical protein ACXADU_18880 [Promethearchaeota archaeon]|jgi:hypothetical protein